MSELEKIKKAHEDIRAILIKYGSKEYGNIIIDEICQAVSIPPTTIYYEEEGLDGKKFDREIFNIILVHVARTWERIRLTRPHQEMPLDNIESAEEMDAIAETIMCSDVVQEFIKNRDGDVWNKYGDEYSDSYIERLSHEIITNNYIRN